VIATIYFAFQEESTVFLLFIEREKSTIEKIFYFFDNKC